METPEKNNETTTTVSVDLSPEQYAFLTNWQKTHEQELGIEVPIGAMARKAIDAAMKAQSAREERPARPPRGDDRGPRPGGGGRPGGFGDRKPFGARPSAGRGPKFDMANPRAKSRTFDK